MAHEHGTHLGGIRTTEDLRGRCVIERIDGGDECWHIRSPYGKPMPTNQRHIIWVFGIGKTTVTRAAHYLATGEQCPDDRIVIRLCRSYDCANYAHMRCVSRKKAVVIHTSQGRMKSPAKTAGARKAGIARRKLSEEMRLWVIQSSQSAKSLAPVLGVSTEVICRIRRSAKSLPKVNSVFSMASA